MKCLVQLKDLPTKQYKPLKIAILANNKYFLIKQLGDTICARLLFLNLINASYNNSTVC